MTTTHTRLMLALTAIKLRCGGAQYDLRTDVLRICDDALLGLNVMRPPESDSASQFDPVRVDGESGYEVQVRRSAAHPVGVPIDAPDPAEKL